jgi:hypothetical protein
MIYIPLTLGTSALHRRAIRYSTPHIYSEAKPARLDYNWCKVIIAERWNRSINHPSSGGVQVVLAQVKLAATPLS